MKLKGKIGRGPQPKREGPQPRFMSQRNQCTLPNIYTDINVKTTVVAVAGEVEKQKECTAESAKGKDRNLKQKQQN